MSSKLVKCEACDGKGRIVTHQFHLNSSRLCLECKGIGRVKPAKKETSR